MLEYGSVDNYMASIKDEKEVLSDPNKNLTPSEIRLGKGKTIKKLSKTEKCHEKILLGDLYRDKEFLRCLHCYRELASTRSSLGLNKSLE